MRPETKVANAGTVGGAIAVILVMMLPKFTSIIFTPEEGAVLAFAAATIFNWLMRFAPKSGE